ncbi:hypothetical protein CC80DRAFT_270124 [Byssothecium circinans]|uniref:Uncharacterized protein n=1 Tax=Byssothecium circinans TaxID=147558 RepID=A0A6A5T953_9PLEO|nr:hypothetical protein CC80DRAFT_270124 [Byssothecium circinans]
MRASMAKKDRHAMSDHVSTSEFDDDSQFKGGLSSDEVEGHSLRGSMVAREAPELGHGNTQRNSLILPINADYQSEAIGRRPLIDWSDSFDHGIADLVIAAHTEEEVKGHAVAKSVGPLKWRRASIHVLASIPEKALKEFISGNLSYAIKTRHDAFLSEYYAPNSIWIARYGQERKPGLYVRIWVDQESGAAPSPRQW